MLNPIPVVAVEGGNPDQAPPGAIPIALYSEPVPAQTPNYGSFYDTVTQPLTANSNHTVLLRETYESEGVSVVGSSKITFERAGVYDVQFSLQVASTTNQTRNLWIWGRINGSDLDHSAGRMSISEQNNVIVPTWNYHVTVGEGDFFELVCRSDGASTSLSAEVATADHPAVASAILSVQQVNL